MQGKKHSAAEKFEEAVKANPNNVAAYLSLGELYQQSKEYQKAMDAYDRVLAGNPKVWVAANNLAFLLCEHGESKADLERATKLVEEVMAQRPDEPLIIDTLGWIYYKKGETGRALGLLERAVSIDPESPILNYHLGMSLYKSGRMDEASQKLQKALDAKQSFMGIEEARITLEQIS
jgi:Tfp pilus assembly protein PilF